MGRSNLWNASKYLKNANRSWCMIIRVKKFKHVFLIKSILFFTKKNQFQWQFYSLVCIAKNIEFDELQMCYYELCIWMTHWRNTMVDGAEFWIICKRLKLLRKGGHLQLIQNSAPSTIVWRQYDIRMICRKIHGFTTKCSNS